MDYTKSTVAAVAVFAVWLLFKKLKRSDIADIRGPDTSWSFILGMTILLPERFLDLLTILQATSSSYFNLSLGRLRSCFWITTGVWSGLKPPSRCVKNA